jgi:hypothetical protein
VARATCTWPRAPRSLVDHELGLPSWQAWNAHHSAGAARGRAQDSQRIELVLCAKSGAVSVEIAVSGISKSAVSERFVVGTQKKLAELMRRRLSDLKLLNSSTLDGK